MRGISTLEADATAHAFDALASERSLQAYANVTDESALRVLHHAARVAVLDDVGLLKYAAYLDSDDSGDPVTATEQRYWQGHLDTFRTRRDTYAGDPRAQHEEPEARAMSALREDVTAHAVRLDFLGAAYDVVAARRGSELLQITQLSGFVVTAVWRRLMAKSSDITDAEQLAA